jgi:hypothetical protein
MDLYRTSRLGEVGIGGCNREPSAVGEFQIRSVVCCELVSFSKPQDIAKNAARGLALNNDGQTAELMGVLKDFFATNVSASKCLDKRVGNLKRPH